MLLGILLISGKYKKESKGKMTPNSSFPFFILFNPGHQVMVWCQKKSSKVFPPKLILSENVLIITQKFVSSK